MYSRLLATHLCFMLTLCINAQDSIKSLLIIGDSHLKGHFGEYLHKNLNAKKNYDILSIAIGGAGSRTFVPELKNQCCGYKVRQTCAGTEIADKTEVPVTEKAESPTKGKIVKPYNGDFKTLLQGWHPDAIIVVLGSNVINAHQELLDSIRSFDSLTPVVWIGPFDQRATDKRYEGIEKALNNFRYSFLVKSSELLADKKIDHVTHLGGKTANKMSLAVIEKFEPFLRKRLCAKTLRQTTE